MNEGARRGVTREYVGSLAAASVVVAAALIVAVWGVSSMLLHRDPVSESTVPVWAAPLILVILLAILAWGLWGQAVVLLKGRRTPATGRIVAHAFGAYLLWSLGGLLTGMTVGDTWLSPFAFALIVIWAVVQLFFWAVLSRRVYTDRPPPRWPWERPAGDE